MFVIIVIIAIFHVQTLCSNWVLRSIGGVRIAHSFRDEYVTNVMLSTEISRIIYRSMRQNSNPPNNRLSMILLFVQRIHISSVGFPPWGFFRYDSSKATLHNSCNGRLGEVEVERMSICVSQRQSILIYKCGKAQEKVCKSRRQNVNNSE